MIQSAIGELRRLLAVLVPSDSARPRLKPDNAAGGYCDWESKLGRTYVAKWTCKSILQKQKSESPRVRVTPIQPPAVKLEMQTSQNAGEQELA